MLDDSAKVEGNAFQQTSVTGLIPTQFEIQLNIVPPDAPTAAVPAVTRLVSDASAAFDDSDGAILVRRESSL